MGEFNLADSIERGEQAATIERAIQAGQTTSRANAKPRDDTDGDSESETFLESGVRIADDSQRKGFVNGRGNNNLNSRD